MNQHLLKIELVNSNLEQARLVRKLLRQVSAATFRLRHSPRLELALGRLKRESTDLVLLDLDPPGDQALATFQQVNELLANLPIIVLTGAEGPWTTASLLAQGVQDHLVKGQFDGFELVRAIENAIARQRALDDLRESEQRNHAIVESALDAIITIDHRSRITEFNTAAEKVFGWPRAEVIGKDMAETIIPPALRQAHRVGMKHYLHSGKAVALGRRIQLTALRADGSQFPVELARMRLDHAPHPMFTAYIRDISERQQAEHDLWLQARIIDQIHDAVAEVDLDGIVRRWNKGSERLLGYSSEEMMGQPINCIYPPDIVAKRQQLVIDPLLHAGQHELEIEHMHKDGRRLWVHLSLTVLHDEAGTPTGVLRYCIDITDRVLAEEKLRLRQRALDASANAVVICDAASPRYPVIYVNPAFESTTGYTSAEVIGRNCSFLQGDDRDQEEIAKLRSALAAKTECRALLRNYRKDGSLFWNELHISPVRDAHGEVTHFVGYQIDVTQRIERQLALEYSARHDELTGLANLRAINERLEQTLEDARSQARQVGVILLDLDRLHHVNDTLGHNAGDQVLVEVAQRLQRLADELGCTVGRMSGDEFVLITQATQESAPSFEAIAQRAMQTLALRYNAGTQPVYLTSSAGVSWYPDAGKHPAQLLAQADLALNRAKQRGRNQLALYSAKRAADIADRIELAAEMREALKHQEISLHYQPLVDAGLGTIVGAEALMRWNSAKLGAVSPDRFIPVAEDTGMIIVLGDWGLHAAIAQISAWKDAGLPVVPISVNVSAVQFQRPEFVEEVVDALLCATVPSRLLKLEITESVLMEDTQTAMAMLTRLKKQGVRISLDDFGTGYSSLAYLRQLPIDEIKIDQNFIKNVVDDNFAATLCRAIIVMSQQLRLPVVAEGVETEAQARFLQDAGCQLLQGSLFSSTVPANSLGALLGAHAVWGMDGHRGGVAQPRPA